MTESYPDNWPELSIACRERAGWRCEECGSGEHLTAAHVNHDMANPAPELRCLCWPCHARYDAKQGGHPLKVARRNATRAKNLAKRNRNRATYPIRRVAEVRFDSYLSPPNGLIRRANIALREYPGYRG